MQNEVSPLVARIQFRLEKRDIGDNIIEVIEGDSEGIRERYRPETGARELPEDRDSWD